MKSIYDFSNVQSISLTSPIKFNNFANLNFYYGPYGWEEEVSGGENVIHNYFEHRSGRIVTRYPRSLNDAIVPPNGTDCIVHDENGGENDFIYTKSEYYGYALACVYLGIQTSSTAGVTFGVVDDNGKVIEYVYDGIVNGVPTAHIKLDEEGIVQKAVNEVSGIIPTFVDSEGETITDLNSYFESQLEGFVHTSDMSNYISTSTLDDRLSEYAQTASINNLVAAAIQSDNTIQTTIENTLNDSSTMTGIVESVVNGRYVGTADIVNYATTTQLQTVDNKFGSYVTTASLDSTLGNYITTSGLNEYAKTSDLSGYATTSRLTDFVETNALNTRLDQYATTAALSGFVTNTHLNNTLENYAQTATLFDDNVLKVSLIPSEIVRTSDIGTYVSSAIASDQTVVQAANDAVTTALNDSERMTTIVNSVVSGNYISTSERANFATTSDITSFVSTSSLTTTLGGYVRTSDLDNTLDGYARTSDLSNFIDGTVLDGYVRTSDITGFVTTANLNNTLNGYINTATLETRLGGYVTTANLDNTLGGYVTTASLDNTLDVYVTTSNLNNTLGGYATTATLIGYARTSDLNNTLTNYVQTSEVGTYVSSAIASDQTIVQAANDAVTTALNDSDRMTTIVESVVSGNYISTSERANFATTSDISSFVSTSSLTTTLDGYAKTSDISGFVTTASLNNTLSTYVTTSNLGDTLDGYAKTSDISGFVTTASLNNTLSTYVTTSNLGNTLDGYAKTSDISGFVTTSEISDFIDTTTLNDTLTSYVQTSVLNTRLNDYVQTGALTTTLNGYARTESLNNYATTSGLETRLSNYIATSERNTFATTAQLQTVDNKFGNYVTSTKLNETLGGYVQTTVLGNYVETATLNEYARTSDLNAYTKTADLNTTLNRYALTASLNNYVQTASLTNSVNSIIMANDDIITTLNFNSNAIDLGVAEDIRGNDVISDVTEIMVNQHDNSLEKIKNIFSNIEIPEIAINSVRTNKNVYGYCVLSDTLTSSDVMNSGIHSETDETINNILLAVDDKLNGDELKYIYLIPNMSLIDNLKTYKLVRVTQDDFNARINNNITYYTYSDKTYSVVPSNASYNSQLNYYISNESDYLGIFDCYWVDRRSNADNVHKLPFYKVVTVNDYAIGNEVMYDSSIFASHYTSMGNDEKVEEILEYEGVIYYNIVGDDNVGVVQSGLTETQLKMYSKMYKIEVVTEFHTNGTPDINTPLLTLDISGDAIGDINDSISTIKEVSTGLTATTFDVSGNTKYYLEVNPDYNASSYNATAKTNIENTVAWYNDVLWGDDGDKNYIYLFCYKDAPAKLSNGVDCYAYYFRAVAWMDNRVVTLNWRPCIPYSYNGKEYEYPAVINLINSSTNTTSLPVVEQINFESGMSGDEKVNAFLYKTVTETHNVTRLVQRGSEISERKNITFENGDTLKITEIIKNDIWNPDNFDFTSQTRFNTYPKLALMEYKSISMLEQMINLTLSGTANDKKAAGAIAVSMASAMLLGYTESQIAQDLDIETDDGAIDQDNEYLDILEDDEILHHMLLELEAIDNSFTSKDLRQVAWALLSNVINNSGGEGNGRTNYLSVFTMDKDNDFLRTSQLNVLYRFLSNIYFIVTFDGYSNTSFELAFKTVDSTSTVENKVDDYLDGYKAPVQIDNSHLEYANIDFVDDVLPYPYADTSVTYQETERVKKLRQIYANGTNGDETWHFKHGASYTYNGKTSTPEDWFAPNAIVTFLVESTSRQKVYEYRKWNKYTRTWTDLGVEKYVDVTTNGTSLTSFNPTPNTFNVEERIQDRALYDNDMKIAKLQNSVAEDIDNTNSNITLLVNRINELTAIINSMTGASAANRMKALVTDSNNRNRITLSDANGPIVSNIASAYQSAQNPSEAEDVVPEPIIYQQTDDVDVNNIPYRRQIPVVDVVPI